jgi:hypothetical protein
MGKLLILILAELSVFSVLPGMFPKLNETLFNAGTLGITGTMMIAAGVFYLSLQKK